MWLSDRYDVPQEVVDGPHSPAFREFLLNWFGSHRRVSFDERLRSANDLAAEEITLAKQLIRQNLKSRHSHIISATWVLGDLDAAPLLSLLLEAEPKESVRLVIAGALWKLNRDPIFIECLKQAKETGLFKVWFHLEQVLWLNDDRAVDFLIDLMPERPPDFEQRRLRRVRLLLRPWLFLQPFRRIRKQMLDHQNDAYMSETGALTLLNQLEAGRNVPMNESKSSSYFRERRNDPVFRKAMLQAVHKAVTEMHQGR